MEHTRFEKVSIKDHAIFDEKWVQERIGEDPTILGLGDLILKDKERIQPGAGRLDLLLQDAESSHRYEVEIQLGATDERHIIRTIEYWDIERKRYPQYDHTAVIVAENITSRFLNVINLFNGTIPLIAVQIKLLKCGDKVSLDCTTVLSPTTRGLVDEDEEIQEATDRNYWENRGSKPMLSMVDELLGIIKTVDPSLELKYNKFYIGLAREGKPSNFVIFRPKKNFLRLEPRLERSDETQRRLETEGLDVMDYDDRWGRYRIRLSKGDIQKHAEFIKELVSQAYPVE